MQREKKKELKEKTEENIYKFEFCVNELKVSRKKLAIGKVLLSK